MCIYGSAAISAYAYIAHFFEHFRARVRVERALPLGLPRDHRPASDPALLRGLPPPTLGRRAHHLREPPVECAAAPGEDQLTFCRARRFFCTAERFRDSWPFILPMAFTWHAARTSFFSCIHRRAVFRLFQNSMVAVQWLSSYLASMELILWDSIFI